MKGVIFKGVVVVVMVSDYAIQVKHKILYVVSIRVSILADQRSCAQHNFSPVTYALNSFASMVLIGGPRV